jgi:hypothetical protein
VLSLSLICRRPPRITINISTVVHDLRVPGGSTDSGRMFEREILQTLQLRNYKIDKSKYALGQNLAGKDYKRAYVAQSPSGKLILVSSVFQDSSGTVQEKVPWEVMSLAAVIRQSKGRFARGYVVLGGSAGWTLKQYFTSGRLQEQIVGAESVIVLDRDTLASLAAKDQL